MAEYDEYGLPVPVIQGAYEPIADDDAPAQPKKRGRICVGPHRMGREIMSRRGWRRAGAVQRCTRCQNEKEKGT